MVLGTGPYRMLLNSLETCTNGLVGLFKMLLLEYLWPCSRENVLRWEYWQASPIQVVEHSPSLLSYRKLFVGHRF